MLSADRSHVAESGGFQVANLPALIAPGPGGWVGDTGVFMCTAHLVRHWVCVFNIQSPLKIRQPSRGRGHSFSGGHPKESWK